MNIREFHSFFPGSVLWRVTLAGVEVAAGPGMSEVEDPGPAFIRRAKAFLDSYGKMFSAASREYQVPMELIVACSLTEADIKEPETKCRKEPGYISDESTPHRISSGLCQLLISTARQTMKDPSIDRAWLNVPKNAIRACASYIKDLSSKTFFDPPAVACAYNAGGVYQQKGAANRWKMRQFPIGTGKHADRFVLYYNAVSTLLNQQFIADGGMYLMADHLASKA